MRLTSSYAVFRADPGEQDLAKARWHGREGRPEAAEREYRAALQRNPDLTTGWMELFELLRRDARHAEALAAAEAAAAHFGPEAAVPLALQGAALAELGRTREAVQALEGALERDGNLALAWHELAYAAHRVGEYSRALLALDRAFALEPHTDSLMLRGEILRDAGQFEAALVAFEGAFQSAEHEPQRHEADREMAATRRAAALGGGAASGRASSRAASACSPRAAPRCWTPATTTPATCRRCSRCASPLSPPWCATWAGAHPRSPASRPKTGSWPARWPSRSMPTRARSRRSTPPTARWW